MPAEPRTPRSGDVLLLTRDASPQFVKPLRFRVIRRHDWPTYHGWCWLDGYQLNDRGAATARRSLYVHTAGVLYLTPAVQPQTGNAAPSRTSTLPTPRRTPAGQRR